MDTQNRIFNIGKRMQVRIGTSAPLSGVQTFEIGQNQPVDRRGEYDSNAQITEAGVTEYTATLEFNWHERHDVFQQLMGVTAGALVDVTLEGFGRPPIVLLAWDRQKSRYLSSVFCNLPLYNSLPLTTTVNEPGTFRLECQPSLISIFPKHAVGQDQWTADGSATTFSWASGPQSGRTAIALSHVYGGRHILDVHAITTLSSGQKSYSSLAHLVTGTTAQSVTLSTAPANGVVVQAWYAYTSVAEASGYAGGTS